MLHGAQARADPSASFRFWGLGFRGVLGLGFRGFEVFWFWGLGFRGFWV